MMTTAMMNYDYKTRFDTQWAGNGKELRSS
jgi:hypothetical protein